MQIFFSDMPQIRRHLDLTLYQLMQPTPFNIAVTTDQYKYLPFSLLSTSVLNCRSLQHHSLVYFETCETYERLAIYYCVIGQLFQR